MARPTKYNKEIIEKARDYLENFNETYNHAIPSVAGLAKVLGLNRDTLYDWASQDEKKDFSDILRQVVSDQEYVLLDMGLKGLYNPTITKLALGKHGYHDKQDSQVSGPNGGPMEAKWTVEFVNATPESKSKA